jgi:predicted acyl esterase
MARRSSLLIALAALSVCLWPSSAAAGPLGLNDCRQTEGVFQCSGLARSWDGVPLDTTVTLPTASSGRLPLVVDLHGFGNSKYEYLDPASTAYTDNAFDWAKRGYAVLTYTSRGLWGSCGTPESRLANPTACARAYLRLADARYEIRDTQELIGRLVDEGFAAPRKIGVTGDSYGGGQSFMLAALNDRTMLPDGRLVPWRSPAGTPLRLAAAAPVIPWTDLVSAIAPNGRELTHTVTPRAAAGDPVGVFKITFAHGILLAAQVAVGPGQPVGEPFQAGRPMGFLAPPGVDPEADVAGWVARADQGEPYDDANARQIISLLERFHSAYQLDSSHRPPPLFVGSGFTDDLFPADEGIRFVNRAKRLYPKLPVSMFLGDFGHQRAANKSLQRDQLIAGIRGWFLRYLKGKGAKKGKSLTGVRAFAQTCPRSAPSSRSFFARSYGRLARGEVRLASGAEQRVNANGGDPSVGTAVDPVTGSGDACATVPAATAPGTATYTLPVRGRGYTLLGSPTIRALIGTSGATPGATQIAGRLWDIGPDGKQTLIARGFYRPIEGRNLWQLHPGAWRFEPGHTVKLELLGNDNPFGRPPTTGFDLSVRNLLLKLPVRQRPNCKSIRPVKLLVPRGSTLAPGWRQRSKHNCRRITRKTPKHPR